MSASPLTLKIECPACRKRIRTPLGMSGMKSNCPACGQRFQIPDLRNKTVMASLAEAPAAIATRPLPIGPELPAELPPATPATAELPAELRDDSAPIVTLAWPPGSYRLAWLALVLLGVSTFVGTVFVVRALFLPAPGSVAQKRSEPVTAEEKAVKAFVVGLGQRPVTFSTWGPHLSSAQVKAMFREAFGAAEVAAAERALPPGWLDTSLCRVVYRVEGDPALHDDVFAVRANGVVEPSQYRGSDDWTGQPREWMAARFPNVKRR